MRKVKIKKVSETFYRFNEDIPFTGCFTVSEGVSYATKVVVQDEIPKHLIIAMGKNRAKMNDTHTSGFLRTNQIGTTTYLKLE